eukprot:TRINITY_DN58078_c0_g1_i1.p1 TRINITY_DN58078_c0_g1~~TRINITY_DN58078_c0_g1_i1.p1  ORF type:complete len:226 (-),score=24.07 TRINITY_DN58078_c0_g1_i1:182-805(-)
MMDMYSQHNAQGRGNSKDDLAADWTTYGVYVSETSTAVRLSFIRKVYSILSIQLLATTILVGITATTPAIQTFVTNQLWMMWVWIIGMFVLLPVMHWKKNESPTNFVLLGVWTICVTGMLAWGLAKVPPFLLLQALGLTTAIMGGLTVYAMTTTRDFTFMGGFLFSMLWGMILVGFLRFFLPWSMLSSSSKLVALSYTFQTTLNLRH